MFDFIRNHRRWLQFILLVLIVPSFFLAGVQGYRSLTQNEAVIAKVAGLPITEREFDQARRNQLEQFRQSLGAQFDAASLDTPSTRKHLLDQLIDQRLLNVVAAKDRFSVSDEVLRKTIAEMPVVQIDGQFSLQRYRQILAAQGLTSKGFEASLRHDLALARVIEPIASSAYLPNTVFARFEEAFNQKRTIRLHRFKAENFSSSIHLSENDIQNGYKAFREILKLPEQAAIEYIVLDEAAANKNISVDDKEINDFYQKNKNRYSELSRVYLSDILITVPASASNEARQAARKKAQTLADQAKAQPSHFAELARKNSQDIVSAAKGGDLGWIGRGILPLALDQAVFKLKSGQISEAIEGPSGFHVLQVKEISPPVMHPLSKVKDKIRLEIHQHKAADRFAEMATKLTDLTYQQRNHLQVIADSLGLKVRKAQGIGRDGLLSIEQIKQISDQTINLKDLPPAITSPDVALLSTPRVRQTVFSPEVFKDKLNSGVVELGPNVMLVVHMISSTPAHIPTFAKVSSQVRAKLLVERTVQASREGAEKELNILQKNTDSVSLKNFDQAQTVSRQQPGKLSPTLLEAVMRIENSHLPVYKLIQDGNDNIIIRLEKVEAVEPNKALRAQLNQHLCQTLGVLEMQAVMQMLRQQYEVKLTAQAQRLIQSNSNSSQEL